MKKMIRPPVLSLWTLYVLSSITLAGELRVPANTGYAEPSGRREPRFSEEGVTRWDNPHTSLSWFGEFKKTGTLTVRLEAKNRSENELPLMLTLTSQDDDDVKPVSVSRSIPPGGDSAIIDFGEFGISMPGYYRFTLTSPAENGPLADLHSLLLDGPAVSESQFNVEPRRNAASVHLFYPVERETQVAAFYCEVTGVDEPVTTYYMATGWHRGYFGMQVNSETERRIIFSVWDSGNEAIDRNKVADENRVRLVARGEDVVTNDFGNEGTGGHSHLKFNWKTGEKQRFLVTAKPVDETHTIFAGYYFHPEKKSWMLISSWNAPHDGGYLRGLYSFSENFWGDTGHVRRKALYGNQWIRTADGTWRELTKARFSHDPTGKSARLDRFMGIEGGQFFLSHGGFKAGFTKYGEEFSRPEVGTVSAELEELFNKPPRGVEAR